MTDPKTVQPTQPVTAKPEEKPATTPVVQSFTKDQLDYIQQVAVASAMAVNNINNTRVQQPTGPKVHPQCPLCQQYVSACEGKHVEMVVFPVKYPEFYQYFPGIKINGVQYLSRNENHRITVPECAASTISNAINAFEQNEKATVMGRSATHNSGSIGKQGTGFKPATAAWR